MECRKELLQILKSDRNWEEKELLKYFKIARLPLYYLFLSFLETEINKLDFDPDTNRYKYLYKVFKYFDNLDDKKIIEVVIPKLKKINRGCSSQLSKAIKEGDERAPFNNVIYKIMDILDVTLLKLKFNHETEIVNDKDNNSNNYQFLYELIYEIKNYDYVFEIFKTSHKLMYTTTPKGEMLIDELITHYINVVIMGDDHYDIIYFEKIIKIFLNSNKFVVEQSYLKGLINKVLLSVDHLKRKKVKKHEIERIRFFLNEVIKDLRQSNNTNDIDDLNYKYGIISTFADDELEEANNLITINDKKYLDLRDKLTITIDSPGTRTYDDACSFEKLKNGNYLLGIYVADVDCYLKTNGILDSSAYKKAETIYLPNHNISMFPYEFSNQVSLNSGTNRFTTGYFFTFDSNMDFVSFNVRRTLINVKHNLNYYEVENILSKSTDLQLFNLLKEMITSTELLKEKQIYDEKYQTVKQIKRTIMDEYDLKFQHGECSIFSTFIVMMDHYIANYFNSHPEIPFPYHVNISRYDDYIVRDLKLKVYNNANFEEIMECLKAIYVPSFYSTENLGHNGLNLTSYSNASNPLRQYISLVTERMVKHHMIDKYDEPLINLNDMNAICAYINNRQEINNEYRQEYAKIMKKKKY